MTIERARPNRSSRGAIVLASVAGLLAVSSMAMGVEGPAIGVVRTVVVAGVTGFSVWALVSARRERRRHEERLIDWAAQRAHQEARLRMARELHDVVSHGLGLITVRAAAARRADDGERSRALADIERAGRQATTELRRMLGMLREPDAPWRPARSLADVPAIVRTATASGLRAVLRDPDDVCRPGSVSLSAGAQLALCAVVREALHNARRHAGTTTATVSLARVRGAVTVTVVDGGRVPGHVPEPGGGLGLTGLRERVAAVDGTFAAAPDGAGWTVRATFADGADA